MRILATLTLMLGLSGPYLPQANAQTLIRICTYDAIIYLPVSGNEEQPAPTPHHACHIACLNDKQKTKLKKQPA